MATADSISQMAVKARDISNNGSMHITNYNTSGSQSPAGAAGQVQVRHNVPSPKPFPVQREAAECQLHEVLTQPPPNVIVISGSAGVGKSELIKRYVHIRCINPHSMKFKTIIWVKFDSDGCLLDYHVREFAKSCNSPNSCNANKEEMLRNFILEMDDERALPVLVVFDNASSLSGKKISHQDSKGSFFDVLKFIHTVNVSRFTIIITSRDKEWGNTISTTTIQMTEFSDEQSRYYLESALGDVRGFDCHKLHSLCGNSPRFLYLLANFIIRQKEVSTVAIDESSYDLHKFMEMCTQGDEFLRVHNAIMNSISAASNNSPLPGKILTYLAFIPFIQVPKKLIYLLLTETPACEGPLKEAIAYLVDLLLLKPAGKVYTLDPNIQLLKLNQLKNDVNVITLVCNRLITVLKEHRGEKDRFVYLKLLATAHHCCKIAENLLEKDVIQDLFKITSDMHKHVDWQTCIDLKKKLLGFYIKQKSESTVRKLQLELADILKQLNPSDCLQILQEDLLFEASQIIRLLAYAKLQLGRFDDALACYDNLYKICQTQDVDLVMEADYYKGYLFMKKGNYHAAIGQLEGVRKRSNNEIPHEKRNPWNAKSQFRIAQCWYKLGEANAAVKEFLELNNYQSKRPDDSGVLAYELETRSEIIKINAELRKEAEGEEKLREVLRLQMELYGSLLDHNPSLTATRQNLVIVLKQKGEYEMAERESELILSSLKRRLDEDHPEILYAQCMLAEVLYLQGKFKRAKKILREVLTKQNEKLGSCHSETVETNWVLIDILCAMKKYKKCHDNLDQVIESLSKPASMSDRWANALRMKTLLKRIDVFVAARNVDEAEKACKGLKDELGEENPLFFHLQLREGAILRMKGRFTKALTILSAGRSAARDILDNERHQDVTAFDLEIAKTNIDAEKLSVASNILQKLCQLQKEYSGPKHLDTLAVRHYLAECRMREFPKPAFENLLEVHRISLCTYGVNEFIFAVEKTLAECCQIIYIPAQPSLLSKISGKKHSKLLPHEIWKKVAVHAQGFRDDGSYEGTLMQSLRLQHCLGSALLQMRQLCAARGIFSSLMRTYEDNALLLLKNNLQYWLARRDYAVVLLQCGDLNQATNQLTEVLEALPKHESVTRFHPERLESQIRMAECLLANGISDRALVDIRSVRDYLARIHGDQAHPSVLRTKFLMAEIYITLGNVKEAQKLNEYVIICRKKVQGLQLKDPLVLSVYNQKAHLRLLDKDFQYAETKLKEIFETRKKRLGNCQETLTTSLLLMECFLMQKNYGKARGAGETSEGLRRKLLLPWYHPLALECDRLHAWADIMGSNCFDGMNILEENLRKVEQGGEIPKTCNAVQKCYETLNELNRRKQQILAHKPNAKWWRAGMEILKENVPLSESLKQKLF